MSRQTHKFAALTMTLLAGLLILIWVIAPGCTLPQYTEPQENAVLLPKEPEPKGVGTQSCCARSWGTVAKATHRTKLTGYFPYNNAMEGGVRDRYSQPLRTLQAYLAGKADYVSVAIDQDLGRVKRRMCSPDLDSAYGKTVKLLVVDTGGAFKGKGFTRADICTANYGESVKSAVNATVTLVECE